MAAKSRGHMLDCCQVESEEPVHRHLAELFDRLAPGCVLDVGANAGQYGELLRSHGYRGWIVSFEPVSAAFEELGRRAQRDGRWRAFRVALGARRERRRIAVAAVSQLSSFRRVSGYGSAEFPGSSETVAAEEVEVRTLNDSWELFLDGVPCERVFLKLDTQGFDLEVLKGADRVLQRLAGLQLEASLQPVYEGIPTFTETLEHVTGLGLALTGVFAVNRDSLFRLIEVDCVFVNPELVPREETWAMLDGRLRREVAGTLPAGADFVLIDEGALGLDELAGRRAVPFLEYGRPEDGAQAVGELRRLARGGVRHLVLAWPAFWWLEEYPQLAGELRSRWRRLRDSDAAIVFERSAETARSAEDAR